MVLKHFNKLIFLILGLAVCPLERAEAQNLLCSLTATITGTNSTACGSLSVVNGNYSLASGYVSSITGSNASAFGAYSFAGGDNSLAMGAHSIAANSSPYNGASNATALGAYSTAFTGATAVGEGSTASAVDAITLGHNALANQSLSIAIGSYSAVTAANSIAIGPNASATAANAIALGSGSTADTANTVSIGAVGSERKLVNLANGTISATSKDAVNGSQLYSVSSSLATNTSAISTTNANLLTANQRVAAAFGGGSTVDGNGIVTTPTYNIQGQNFTNVGSALGALDTQVTTNTSGIATLNSQLNSGAIGLVQQNGTTRTIHVASAVDGTLVDFTGTAGARKLTGLLAGTVSGSSSDAVNGAQLNATNLLVSANTSAISTNSSAIATANAYLLTTNQRLVTSLGGGSAVDANGVFTVPSYSVQGQSYNNVGGALGALDTKVSANTAAASTNATNLTTLTTQVTNGAIGLVRQDAVTRNLSVAAATDGSLVDFTGTAGTRKLTGLQAGTVSGSSTDAVNGAQLNATNQLVSANSTAISANSTALSTANANFLTANQRVAAAFGGGSGVDANGIVTAPSYSVQGQSFNNIGGALGALDTKVSGNSGDITTLNTQLSNGSIGLTRQDAVSRNISIAALTDGTLVDVTGTAGARKLTGLQAGAVSASSSDAVNGAQLNATNQLVSANSTAISASNTAISTANANFLTANQRVASAFGGGAGVDANGIFTAPSYSVQGQSFNNVGGALGALDTKVTSNTSDIATINTQLASSGIGLTRQDAITRTISIASATDGSVLDVTGTAGTRRLTGLQAGTLASNSTDAVNGAQLNATNQAVSANSSAISTNSSAISTANSYFLTANQRLASAFGGGAGIDANGIFTAPSYSVQGQSFNNVGGALGALDTKVTSNTSDIATITTQLASSGIGLTKQDAITRTISIASATDGTVLDVTGTAGARRLTGLQAGTLASNSTDAVNGAQLNATNQALSANSTALGTANTNFLTANQRVASAFGGGAGVDGNGILTTPSYSVQGQTFNNVGGALGAIDTRVTSNTSDIATISSQVASGNVGLTRQDAVSRNISIASATDGTTVDFTGTAGGRRLTGLQAGSITSNSTDAVNGAQLNATNQIVSAQGSAISANNTAIATANSNALTANQRIASAFGGGAGIDANGIVTAPSYAAQGQTYNNVGGAIGAIDSKVTSNTTDIATINTQLSNGAIGLVKQDVVSRNISIASATDGNLIDVSGTAGTRKLTGLQAGAITGSSTDAVNGAQLNATNQMVSANSSAIATNSSAISTANANFLTANQRVATAFGGGSTVDANGIVTAPSYSVQGQTFGNVGGALGALDTRVTTNTSDITMIGTQLANGAIGLVRQDAVTRGISVASANDGNLVDFTGTAGTRKLTGLQAGAVTSASTDAVNGSQLYTTNQLVAANTSAISANNAAITTTNAHLTTANQRIAAVFGSGIDANGIVTAPTYSIQGQNYNSLTGALGSLDTAATGFRNDINTIQSQLTTGAIGLVKQDSISRELSIGATTDGDTINAAGTNGYRRLTGLQSGSLSSSSTDAVTGGQLYATNSQVSANVQAIADNAAAISAGAANFVTANQRLAGIFGGGSGIDGNGIVTAPSYLVLGNSYSNIGNALTALSNRVTTNSSNISNLMSGGTGGLGTGFVTQDPVTRGIGVGTTTDGTAISIAGSDGNRTVSGLAAGRVDATSTEAVNGAQLAATNAAVSSTATSAANTATGVASALGGNAAVGPNGQITAPQYTIAQGSYNSVGGALGAVDSVLTANSTAINNLTQHMTTRTRYMLVNGTGSDAAAGTNAVALGSSSSASGTQAVAIGAHSSATQTGAIAIGGASAATGVNAIAIGTNAVATGSVAVGVNAQASNGGAALGDNTVATATNSAALGPNSSATAANSVAIGSGSVAAEENVVSVGSTTTSRRIVNVAAGISPTDAVNVSQLNDTQTVLQGQIDKLETRTSQLEQGLKRTKGGVAMAMAMAGSNLPDNKRFGLGMNVGTYAGQYAMSVSSHLRLNNTFVVSSSVAYQDGQVGGRAGLMAAW